MLIANAKAGMAAWTGDLDGHRLGRSQDSGTE
jgi:hypothetical protein